MKRQRSGSPYTVPQAAVQATRVGADLLLFGAPAREVAARTARVVGALVDAVEDGRLPEARLREAAVHVLATKHAVVCR